MKRLATVRQEIDCLVSALATTGSSPSVAAAIMASEPQQHALTQEPAALDQSEQMAGLSGGDISSLEKTGPRQGQGLARSDEAQHHTGQSDSSHDPTRAHGFFSRTEGHQSRV
jgi:hypothetical protein